jgi:hypothetical protein
MQTATKTATIQTPAVKTQEKRDEVVRKFVSASVCTPAHRMLVLDVWDNGDGTFSSQLSPVVALKVSVIHEYERTLSARTPHFWGPVTHAALTRAGFHLAVVETLHEVVYVGDDGGVVGLTSDKECYTPDDGDRHVLTCTWPVEQDEENLAPIIQQHGQEVVERERRRRRHE